MPALETDSSESKHSVETLVRYVEVWTVTEDGSALELNEAAGQPTGALPSSHHAGTTISPGEGIAGRAWQDKSVLIETSPDGQLDEFSTRCGFDATVAIAIPVFCQQQVRGVVIMGCGNGYGAAEIWSRDDRDELAVSSSFYAGLPSFEFISRYTRFPKGAGIPGQVWLYSEARMLENLGQSDTFIRSFENDPADIAAAIGIPIGHESGFPRSVLLLLSASKTPFASLTELWQVDEQTLTDQHSAEGETAAGIKSPELNWVSSETLGEPQPANQANTLPQPWQLSILQQMTERRGPILVERAAADLPPGAVFVLAIPIFHGEKIRSILIFAY